MARSAKLRRRIAELEAEVARLQAELETEYGGPSEPRAYPLLSISDMPRMVGVPNLSTEVVLGGSNVDLVRFGSD